MVHATAARGLTLGNFILSVPVCIRDSLLGFLGKGGIQMHPVGRFPTYPLRVIAADTLGTTLGDLCS